MFVRISAAETQNSYEWREEMASCITEISHGYDFPLSAVPVPQSNEQWHTGHADVAKVWKVTLA
jgi:hypothetical protein